MLTTFRMGTEQRLAPVAWISNNKSQHIVLSGNPNMLSQMDVACSLSSSFGSYSGFFSTGKLQSYLLLVKEIVNGLLNELNGNASLRLQLAGQYQYFPYNLNLLNDPKFQPASEMNLQESNVDFHLNGSFETPKLLVAGPPHQDRAM